MRKTKLLAGTVMGGLVALAMAGAASAADLPRRTEVPVIQPVPIFTWTGFYVGATAGYVFGNGNSRFSGVLPAGFVPLGNANSRDDGFIVGGTIGYNYQFTPNFVAGIEADLSYTDIKKSASNGFITLSREMNYLGTVRGRLGYTFDRFMVYGTGGLAYANVKSQTNIAGLGSLYTGSKDDTRTGWTVGGGVEYAITNNISAKVEYLYYDLGRESYGATYVSGPVLAGFVGNTRTETRGNIVRGGVNYRF